ncbi:MAG: DUF3450 domain-containing protein [Pseudomonadota bacterium]
MLWGLSSVLIKDCIRTIACLSGLPKGRLPVPAAHALAPGFRVENTRVENTDTSIHPVGSRMKQERTFRLAACALVAALGIASLPAQANSLREVFGVADQLNTQAKRSQARIDALTDQTRELIVDYKTVLKEIDGLRVYNRQLEKQIENQETEMAALAKSIDDVTLIERQVSPFMLRMIDGLEQFVSLDMPFLKNERTERVENLRSTLDRADVAVSEKFNQVMRAYQIENEYGRTMEAYEDTITVDGTERKVDVLKVGRIALVYQSKDGEETGVYNKTTKQWEQLPDAYKSNVRNGIRMGRKQLTPNLLSLPVPGAGGAE